MKSITYIDGGWRERVNPNITAGERSILNDRNTPPEERRTLLQAVRSRSYADISQEEQGQAQSLYNAHKIDGAQLIGADIVLPLGSGIINCRVNGEYQQIRF